LGLLGTRHGRGLRCLRQSRCRAEHAMRAGQEQQTSDEGEGPHASVHSGLLSAIGLIHHAEIACIAGPPMFTSVEARRLSNERSIAAFVKRLEERAFHGNLCESFPETHPVRKTVFDGSCCSSALSSPAAALLNALQQPIQGSSINDLPRNSRPTIKRPSTKSKYRGRRDHLPGGIAYALNARGVQTPRGGFWHARSGAWLIERAA